MKKSGVASALSELRSRDPDLPLAVLLWRIVAWKLHRLRRNQPVVPLHSHSSMKLNAAPHEHGIQAAVFLFRDAYEPSVRHAIDTYVKEGDAVYDIGANLGLWTLRMLERVGESGSVCAFEPNPETAERLESNIALSGHKHAQIRALALGSENGTLTLYVPDDVGRSSLAAESDTDRKIDVPVRPLDDIWMEQGRPHISFVKMDIEGAEPLVFRGAREFFKASRPVVCCEVNVEKLRNMGFMPIDATHPLSDLGYRALIWNETQKSLVPMQNPEEIRVTCDLVFIPH